MSRQSRRTGNFLATLHSVMNLVSYVLLELECFVTDQDVLELRPWRGVTEGKRRVFSQQKC